MPALTVVDPVPLSSAEHATLPELSVVSTPPLAYEEQLYVDNVTPPPITTPPANVDDAVEEITFNAFACSPFVKVEVAVPVTFKLAATAFVAKKFVEVALVVVDCIKLGRSVSVPMEVVAFIRASARAFVK